MISKICSSVLLGMDGVPVDVETDLSNGLPMYAVVGLPDAMVRESRERVRAAIKNSGFDFPMKRITVNLTPASTKKEGSHLDLPMALGIMAASLQIPPDAVAQCGFAGELSLDGQILPVTGILPLVISMANSGCQSVFVPMENLPEALIVESVNIYGISDLKSLCRHLCSEERLEPATRNSEESYPSRVYDVDFSDVLGQEQAKRAMEIAASGAHNLLIVGPPGAGKTMLAKRFPTILPNLSYEEALEVTKIYSVSALGGTCNTLAKERPFRSPHHTISSASLVGGGTNPKPGEVSLAHYGILYLDEFTEFNRSTLEVLRQPMEDERVTISRVSQTITFPCKFTLLASMNPCPCGFLTDPTKSCTCSPGEIKRYLSKVSGPLLDRIDLQVEAVPVPFQALRVGISETSSEIMKQRVMNARTMQEKRYKGTTVHFNSQLSGALLRKHCHLDLDSEKILESAFQRLSLSARAYAKILRVSRTIADLDSSEIILKQHVAEAVQYRNLDRLNPYGGAP